jgi:hypothetical protein
VFTQDIQNKIRIFSQDLADEICQLGAAHRRLGGCGRLTQRDSQAQAAE